MFQRIENACFKNCTGLIAIELPDSVVELHDECFMNCSQLKEFRFPAGLTAPLGKRAFQDCSTLAILRLPSLLTTVGAGSFRRCSALRDVEFPTSLKVLGNGAFEVQRILQTYHTVPIPFPNTSFVRTAVVYFTFVDICCR